MTDSRNSRKVRTGVVTSVSGAKTIVVTITERKRHPKYGKMMTSSKKLHAHDEECTAGVGDTVRVMETRPMSKMKRWRLIEVGKIIRKIRHQIITCPNLINRLHAFEKYHAPVIVLATGSGKQQCYQGKERI